MLPPESDLMRVFEVSRNTLREALRVLESESLIRIRRGRGGGAVIQRVDLRRAARYVSLLLQVRGATVEEIQEARLVLERPAATALAANPPAGALDRLTDAHERQLALIDEPLSSVAAMTRFDQAVTELSGSKTLTVLSGILRDIIAGQAYRVGQATRGRAVLRRLPSFHEGFLDAVRERNAGTAYYAWTDYLSESAKLLGKGVRESEIDVVPLWQAEISATAPEAPAHTMATSIATRLRSRIAEGTLKDGDRLPATADLVASFGVSRPTMREALRILEMEGLLDLRTGSRTGARVCEPTTHMAAQLAGIVLESMQTALRDVWDAKMLIEPAVMELVAARIDREALADLAVRVEALRSAVGDTPAFIKMWDDLERRAFSATRNSAIWVAVEILHWVNVGCQGATTVSALSLPGVIKTNERACDGFAGFVAAARDGDAVGAGRAWADYLQASAPFFHSSLGDRLIVDLFG